MAELMKHQVLQDEGKPQRLVVMLHGMGQHPGYMEEAARMLIQRMPGTLVVMPEAPLKMHYSAEKTASIREKYDPAFDPDKARSWFKTDMMAVPKMALRLVFNSVASVNQVNKLADQYRDKYGLQNKDIAFFGMSQGGAIATYAAIARKEPCAGVVNHSGMFFGFARAKSKPDVLMIRGEDDNILCDNKSKWKKFFVAPEGALRRLKRRSIPVTEIICSHLGHDMNGESLAHASEFLADAFKVPVSEAVVKSAPQLKTLSA